MTRIQIPCDTQAELAMGATQCPKVHFWHEEQSVFTTHAALTHSFVAVLHVSPGFHVQSEVAAHHSTLDVVCLSPRPIRRGTFKMYV